MTAANPRFRRYRSWPTGEDGFMLTELLVGIVILGLLSASIIWGLNQLNAYATSSRLYTAAQTLAQNQIDLLLTRGPFNPQLSPPDYPSPNILQVNSNGTPYTYYTNPANGSISPSSVSVPIYTDPSSNKAVVSGTIATTNQSVPFAVGGTNLTVIKTTVTVSYTFRNKTYNVSMDTMRTSDL